MEFQSIRGFQDILPPQSERTAAFEALARRVLSYYGFREIRLPTVELKALFVKSTGETSDIVEKEMYEFEDQGGRRLALRPEGTPGTVRAFLQHHLQQDGGRSKLFYIGNMFRAERPQAGRFREFNQIGVESIGNAHAGADAEVILALGQILDEAGLKGRYKVELNTLGCDQDPQCRPAFRERLKKFLERCKADLCEHCQRRMFRNPLRALDCKADGPILAEKVPPLQPCGTCRKHGERTLSFLEKSHLPHKYPVPSLVRGLDYYNRVVFEFKSDALGAQDALGGGGRYDGLVKSMGGPDLPAVGWAMGIERALMALEKGRDAGQTEPSGHIQVYVAIQDAEEALENQAYSILSGLRAGKIAAEGGFGHSLKSQMREANRLGARWAVILGKQEAQKNACILKDMRAKDAQEVISIEHVQARILKNIGHG